jgi:D-sedoheptulose 7-phosphate isomerase
VKLLTEARRVFIIGNGGSYANAMHICNDFLMVGINACTLDPASLTASANDYGYETVFQYWIRDCGHKDDVLVILSGSGRSKNILRAHEIAKVKGMKTVAVLGAYNEPLLHPDVLVLGGEDMQKAEEHQIVWGHEVMKNLRKCA